jgi:hypothetical protein
VEAYAVGERCWHTADIFPLLSTYRNYASGCCPPKAKRTPRTVAAWCVIGVLTVAVLATISFIFWLKSFSIQLNSDCQPKNQFLYDYGGYIATLINIVQKDVGNTLYGTAAVRLTVHVS